MTSTANRTVTAVETYTGRYVDLLNPDPETICLADIAVGLANTSRFAGQVSRFYSVAEHSVRVAASVPWQQLALPALLHDAHEAYTGDITAPMKQVLELAAPGIIKDLQHRLDVAIATAMGTWALYFKDPEIKRADDEIMFREAAGLKYSHGIGEHWGNTEYHEPLTAYGWTPAEAERRFIETYERLTK
jgi:hypothetical protein